jgi:conjugative relaxase-like TrwC/TraI family protein
VLSRGKITPGRVRYYTQTVASGLDDYLSGHGEAPGRWEGAGAKAAGLSGEATSEQIALLFESENPLHPLTGEPLGRPYKVANGVDKVLGWDLTLSPPKSFSTMWALGDRELRDSLAAAHKAALQETIAYLEEHAAFSRTGRGGVAQVDTEGLLIARFDHRTSRAGDPQKHSHLLVSSRVRCADGVWRALDSKALQRQLKPAGMLYQAALRAECTARLGVEWGVVGKSGQADIAGVPEGLLTFWSKRRKAIDIRAAERITMSEAVLGRPLTDAERRSAYQQATLETRPEKEAVSGDLHGRWAAEAAMAGFPPERWVGRVLGRHLHGPEVTPESVVPEALVELERSKSTWGRADAMGQVAARLPAGLAATAAEARAWAEHLADTVVADGQVVALAGPGLPPATGFVRRDGRSVFEHHAATRYTTRTSLALEGRVLDFASDGRDSGIGVANAGITEDLVVAHQLASDQAEAVRRLTLGGEQLICLVGPAGTGKTRTVGAAADIWQTAEIPVRGLAVSAVAAEVLGAEAGIPADTLAKLLYEHDRPGGPRSPYQLQRGEVVVVDEASQVATADFARLVELAKEAGAKIVAVGDYRQLGSVDAGGLFRLLAHDGVSVELTGVWRFEAKWEKEASLRLRSRDPDVLAEYEAHGRLQGGSHDEMVEAAFRQWVGARAAHQSVVVMGDDLATVDALAIRVRAMRVRMGEVEPGGVAVGEQVVGYGDEIVSLRNDRRLVTDNDRWVRNGDRWVVERRRASGALQVRSLEGRGGVWLPAGYVAENVALAYAVTLQKAQGVTVDRGVLLA